ncbi:Rz1-like lysis system protein LysC [Yersinia ruckeri]|uniref:Rz1-like lysis system protein LysC n=1 Tax=Yersinia ruckeri TaxID=29486 RepID=UPI0022646725|nr:Rz1-like lysis system protein LysC [Yersinia ruckeri]UZX96570.1 Rz1-like lysis system protein LysC [Yersinia ruckeri]
MTILPGCTRALDSTIQPIIYVGCPKVTSCPIPSSQPKTNGDLSEDNRQLERALVSCALQIETLKQCQESPDVKAEKPA